MVCDWHAAMERAIRLAVEQRFQLFCGGDIDQRFQRGLGLGDDFGIALGLAHLDQFDIVVQTAVDHLVGRNRVQQLLPFAHQLLRLGRVVPQIGRFDHRVELFQTVLRRFPVQPLRQQVERFLDRFDVVLRFGAHGGFVLSFRCCGG